MENGYIKLHRKLIKWEWYKKSEMVHLFLHFLLLANHEQNKWQGQIIEKGQFITGRKSLSEDTGISEQTIRTCISALKSTNEITTKSTNKFTIITIVKWETYQNKSTSKSTSELTNNQPTTNQQLTTNKNDKNDKNEKKGAFAPPSLNEVKDYCDERKNKIDPQGFVDFYESKGWFVGKNKMKDWRACVRTWEGRDSQKGREKKMTFNGQPARNHFGTYQVFSGGEWRNLDPKFIKEIKEV